eukprot:gnl/Hemi2/657_TR233_c0_g2_i1.p2 gnl/Hemi2/657_TR233_c0_g2~~gnl/Hemi2/657_TR233_c0_g2_i1.p2  ORF type:complete len:145 (-),score=29.47 gnl/Hemi2/657_TR233_c0_g2_i1:352-750(-)
MKHLLYLLAIACAALVIMFLLLRSKSKENEELKMYVERLGGVPADRLKKSKKKPRREDDTDEAPAWARGTEKPRARVLQELPPQPARYPPPPAQLAQRQAPPPPEQQPPPARPAQPIPTAAQSDDQFFTPLD